MAPPFWTIGCIYGATSVALGAFGAHGLKKRIADPARLQNWGTAAQYQVCIQFTKSAFSLSAIFYLETIEFSSSILHFALTYFYLI
jgi:uncharacterized membrane protein YgdD (TMEM256/DUF423 family)